MQVFLKGSLEAIHKRIPGGTYNGNPEEILGEYPEELVVDFLEKKLQNGNCGGFVWIRTTVSLRKAKRFT